MIGSTSWHDVIVRFTGPKLELFVDGVLVDEEWPIGSLRQGNLKPCLIGASSCGDEVKAGFWGMIDHVALWNRALSDDEIEFLSGGKQEISLRETEILGEPGSSSTFSAQYWRPKGHNTSVEKEHAIHHVEGLERPFTLDIILKDDIVDVCVDNRRTIIGRYKGHGDRLFFFAQNADVVFDSVEIRQLLK